MNSLLTDVEREEIEKTAYELEQSQDARRAAAAELVRSRSFIHFCRKNLRSLPHRLQVALEQKCPPRMTIDLWRRIADGRQPGEEG
jgi:hypothetical protein